MICNTINVNIHVLSDLEQTAKSLPQHVKYYSDNIWNQLLEISAKIPHLPELHPIIQQSVFITINQLKCCDAHKAEQRAIQAGTGLNHAVSVCIPLRALIYQTTIIMML